MIKKYIKIFSIVTLVTFFPRTASSAVSYDWTWRNLIAGCGTGVAIGQIGPGMEVCGLLGTMAGGPVGGLIGSSGYVAFTCLTGAGIGVKVDLSRATVDKVEKKINTPMEITYVDLGKVPAKVSKTISELKGQLDSEKIKTWAQNNPALTPNLNDLLNEQGPGQLNDKASVPTGKVKAATYAEDKTVMQSSQIGALTQLMQVVGHGYSPYGFGVSYGTSGIPGISTIFHDNWVAYFNNGANSSVTYTEPTWEEKLADSNLKIRASALTEMAKYYSDKSNFGNIIGKDERGNDYRVSSSNISSNTLDGKAENDAAYNALDKYLRDRAVLRNSTSELNSAQSAFNSNPSPDNQARLNSATTSYNNAKGNANTSWSDLVNRVGQNQSKNGGNGISDVDLGDNATSDPGAGVGSGVNTGLDDGSGYSTGSSGSTDGNVPAGGHDFKNADGTSTGKKDWGDVKTRFQQFTDRMKQSSLFGVPARFFAIPNRQGTSLIEINGGATFGVQTFDLASMNSAWTIFRFFVLFACSWFGISRALKV